MGTYAIVEASGKQFLIEENRFYDLDALPLTRDESFQLNKILLVKTETDLFIGKPYLNKEFKVEATVLRNVLTDKIRVYKMRPKKKTRKTFGHRSKKTRVLINKISPIN
mgnify:CR=1 FL=1